MPEGHTIHRAARDHARLFSGQRLAVSSPQGRFAEGAAEIDGLRCDHVEAFGKHLVYRFAGQFSLHLHLGLFGRIKQRRLPLRPPRGAVRVRLAGDSHFADVNGPTICELLDRQALEALAERIGSDPLRDDADPDRAFARISRSRAPIGRLLMDQSVIAGIGNIYRTEFLWRQKIHPETAGRSIDRMTFDRLWDDASQLLTTGVNRNAIITVEGGAPARSRYRERVNIFGKPLCPRCNGPVRRYEIDSRRIFTCEQCQVVTD